MKRTNKSKVAIALALASIPVLTGCGSNSNNQNGVGGIYGSVMGPGACIPISTTIPFTATNMYFDYANMAGGVIPPTPTSAGQTVGTVALGGGTGGPYQRQGVDGTISMNIIPVNQAAPTYPGAYPGTYPTYPTTGGYTGGPTTANATGIITIAAATQQDILYKAQMGAYGTMPGTTPGYPTTGYPTAPGTYPTYPGMPMPTAPASTVCVSGIAFNLGHYNNTIYGGNVFLYLNNTQHGYALYF